MANPTRAEAVRATPTRNQPRDRQLRRLKRRVSPTRHALRSDRPSLRRKRSRSAMATPSVRLTMPQKSGRPMVLVNGSDGRGSGEEIGKRARIMRCSSKKTSLKSSQTRIEKSTCSERQTSCCIISAPASSSQAALSRTQKRGTKGKLFSSDPPSNYLSTAESSSMSDWQHASYDE